MMSFSLKYLLHSTLKFHTTLNISLAACIQSLAASNTTTRINTTETGNLTVSVQPNGLGFGQGQSVLVTEGDNGSEQETATTTFVDISRTSPDGSGNSTQVMFFSTNSTGQLAFLDNIVAIAQVEFTAEGGNIRMWEWKGGTLPFENGIDGGSASAMENQTSTTPVSQRRIRINESIANSYTE